MNNCLNCYAHTINPKYCSRSCSATFNNRVLVKSNARQESFCFCGTSFLKNSRHQKFCSQSCAAKHNRKNLEIEYISMWLSGNVTGSTKHGTSEFVRNYLEIKQKKCCAKCLNSVWMDNPIPLELEHKDGNYKNNSAENVCLLCPNCHSQTLTYGSKNKGRGRPKRSAESKATSKIISLAIKEIRKNNY